MFARVTSWLSGSSKQPEPVTVTQPAASNSTHATSAEAKGTTTATQPQEEEFTARIEPSVTINEDLIHQRAKTPGPTAVAATVSASSTVELASTSKPATVSDKPELPDQSASSSCTIQLQLEDVPPKDVTPITISGKPATPPNKIDPKSIPVVKDNSASSNCCFSFLQSLKKRASKCCAKEGPKDVTQYLPSI